jgi:hypothetical protein
MKKQLSYLTGVLLVSVGISSCEKDLNRYPTNGNTSQTQYQTVQGYKEVLAKAYGSYSLSSSQGTGVSDIQVGGISDPGTTDFVRAYFNAQELTTDNDICAWNDGDLQAFHNMRWTSTNIYLNALYSRSLYQITVCNEFIRQSTDASIGSHGFNPADAAEIVHYRAEARFLRAYQYWVLMDLFGNPPFVTEKDPIGKYIPKQILRADLFNFIESELLAISDDLVAPRQNEYGRADQAADWALLARLYLNSEVYLGTGKGRFDDAATYSGKVIGAGYALKDSFRFLFMSDNNLDNPEVILPIAYDATSSQNYGGTTFLICSAHTSNVYEDSVFGIPAGAWLGNRSTANLPAQFAAGDKRALFSPGQTQISDALDFGQGLMVWKFSNKTSKGITPYSPNGTLVNTDFPLFRMAEMYLTYIEAVSRGAKTGDQATALTYFNTLRRRAYSGNTGDVAGYTLNDILNERQRELYWEGFRRTDLIRYGLFTSGTYVWPWKGGVASGTGVDDHLNVFPLPVNEILANPNLIQNPGY